MSLELLTALASIGTFVVIGATAIVAVVQLRHMRAGNQIAAVMQLDSVLASEEFRIARRFLREELGQQLRDPEFRKELMGELVSSTARQLLIVGNCYEEMGLFVKRGIIAEEMACDLWSAQASGDWKRMSPAIAIVRRSQGSSVWENFEYFVSVSDDWLARYPHGTFPKDRHRQQLEDAYLEEDGRAAAR